MWIVYLRDRVNNQHEPIGRYYDEAEAKQAADKVEPVVPWEFTVPPRPDKTNDYQRQLTYDTDIVVRREYAPENGLDEGTLAAWKLAIRTPALAGVAADPAADLLRPT